MKFLKFSKLELLAPEIFFAECFTLWKKLKNAKVFFYLITCIEKLESLMKQFTLWTNLKYFKNFLLRDLTMEHFIILPTGLLNETIWNTSKFHYLNGFVENKIHFLPTSLLRLKNFLVWIPCWPKFEFFANQLGS